MIKFMSLFLWILSLILVWGVSKNNQFSHLTSTIDYIIIITSFLLVISPPIYWIFTFSEASETPTENQEIISPQAEIFIDNIISQQNTKSLSPSIIKKSESDIAKIFAKVEKLVVGSQAKEELRSTKKQIQIKILRLLNEQLFAIEKLQEEALMMIEISEYLSDSEKLLLCHHIKLYITEKNKNLIE